MYNLHLLENKIHSLQKSFKNSNLKISFKTENIVGNFLNNNQHINPNKFNKCGIYKITRQNYNREYIGLTCRHFCIRFQEHCRDNKHGN